MSMIYDNWERLVDAVLDREHFRQLCRDNSSVYSIGTSSDSRFSSPLNDVAPIHFPSPAPNIDARSSPSSLTAQSVFQQGQTSSGNKPTLTKAVFKVDVKDDRGRRKVMKTVCSFSVAIQPLLRPFSVISNMRHFGFSTMSSGVGGDGHQEVELKLSPSSALKIQKGDITRWSIDGSSDAIVNPTNERMLGWGGADGAIHRAAGPELRAACYEVPEVKPGFRCPTGEARITPGFRLPASHVIHTVGPIYYEDKNPEASLRNAYKNSLQVAKESNIQYIAFAAISCGVYGYPYEEAAMVAISTVKESAGDFKEEHFVLFSDEIYDVWLKKARELLQE